MPGRHHVFRNTFYKYLRSPLQTVVRLDFGPFLRLHRARWVNCHKAIVPFHRKSSSQGPDELRTLAKDDVYGVVLSQQATQYCLLLPILVSMMINEAALLYLEQTNQASIN